MDDTSKTVTGKTISINLSLLPVVALALIGLKLFGVISLAWGWVLIPTFLVLLPFAIFLLIMMAGVAFLAVVALYALVASILDIR